MILLILHKKIGDVDVAREIPVRHFDHWRVNGYVQIEAHGEDGGFSSYAIVSDASRNKREWDWAAVETLDGRNICVFNHHGRARNLARLDW